MKNITQKELEVLLKNHKGATPITISAITDTRARKTDNPFDKILKFSVINGFTGFDYQASVNRQQNREGGAGDFNAQQRKWGTNINNVLVEDKGKFYLVIRPLRCTKPIFLGQKGNNVVRVAKESIAQFLPTTYSSADKQGVDKEIVYRNYSLDSIRSITFKGEKYQILR